MIWLVYSFLIIASIVVFFIALTMIFEGNWMWKVCGFLMLVVLLAYSLHWVVSRPDPGPCFKWETQLMFNAATKTMMPARVCVLRGEWVEQE